MPAVELIITNLTRIDEFIFKKYVPIGPNFKIILLLTKKACFHGKISISNSNVTPFCPSFINVYQTRTVAF